MYIQYYSSHCFACLFVTGVRVTAIISDVNAVVHYSMFLHDSSSHIIILYSSCIYQLWYTAQIHCIADRSFILSIHDTGSAVLHMDRAKIG